MKPIFHYQALPLIAALLPTYLLRFSVFGLPTNLFETLIITTALLGLLSPPVRRSWRQLPSQLPPFVMFFIGLFFLSALLATIISPHLLTSLGILKSWIIIPIIYAFTVAAAPISPLKYLQALLTSGLIIALHSLSALGHTPRLQAFYDTPNSLALFLAPLTTLAFFLCISEKKSIFHHRLYLFAFFIILIALLGTQSVGGIVAMVIAITLGLLTIRKLRFHPSLAIRHWPLRAFLVALFIGVTVWTYAPKIHYLLQKDSSAFVRLQLWSVSLDLIQDHLLTGLGLGTFEPAYQQQLHQRFAAFTRCLNIDPPPDGCDVKSTNRPLAEFVYRDPHNWLLSFYLNLGPLGLVAFISLNIFVFFRGIRSLKITEDPAKLKPNRENYSASWRIKITLLATLATILLHGLVDTIYWKNDLAAVWWLLMSLLVTVKKGELTVISTPAPEYPLRTAD